MPQPDDSGVMYSSTPPADTITWDWREQLPMDRLAEVLARRGVTLTEVDTGSDQFEVRVSSNPLHAADRALDALDQASADTPEPATAPAEHVQDSPAGDHAPAGTPEPECRVPYEDPQHVRDDIAEYVRDGDTEKLADLALRLLADLDRPAAPGARP